MLSRRAYFFLPYVCLVFAIANEGARAEDAGGSGGAPQAPTADSGSGQDPQTPPTAADPNDPNAPTASTAEDEQSVEQDYESLIQDDTANNTDNDDTLADFEKKLSKVKKELENEAKGNPARNWTRSIRK